MERDGLRDTAEVYGNVNKPLQAGKLHKHNCKFPKSKTMSQMRQERALGIRGI